jgi:lipoprotein-anchoring transpeptidase ErfK/SrfK
MCYRSVWEKLAERFQMTPALLQELNPAENVDAVAAGDILVVPDPAPVVPLVAPVAKIRIEVDVRTLTALDTEGHLLRQYPTVVGETFAGYRGELTVAGITYDPSYRMDPETWKELPASWPAVTIPPGPNSPVGLVWMQLSREGYGIHGTGDPETIGHTESHGCVRLTNWSALELAAHVQPGVTRVDFVGLGRG